MSIKHKLAGELAQSLTCQLDQGQAVFAEAGTFRWKTTNVGLETHLISPKSGSQFAPKGGGGLLGTALAAATEVGKRALAGDGVAFQWFRASGGSGLVSFAGELAGQMRVLELGGNGGWFVQRGAFVCAEDGVDFDIAFTAMRVGAVGGDGLVLQHFTGTGTLVVAGGGNLVELDPGDYGGKLQLHAGAVAAFADSIEYGVERVGGIGAQAAVTAMFGGQSLYVATLTGSGPVLVQTALHRTMEAENKRDGSAAGLLGRL